LPAASNPFATGFLKRSRWMSGCTARHSEVSVDLGALADVHQRLAASRFSGNQNPAGARHPPANDTGLADVIELRDRLRATGRVWRV